MPKKLTLAIMQQMAQKRGGLCLSKVYCNTRTHLVWQCAKGHMWKAKPSSIQQGTWCPHCLRTITILDMQQLAQDRGGKCLSEIYRNNKTPLLWQCANGHQWKALLCNIKKGQWCRRCFKENQLAKLQKIAHKKGGKCLSDNYINNLTPLLWQCAKGHQWKTRSCDIQRGHWCPSCSSRKCERICRRYFEILFEAEFPTVRPFWITNENGNYLELDGFNPDLRIAFEHNGRQHYQFDSYYNKTETAFFDVQKNDEIKRQACKEHGVLLIEIPELFKRTLPQKLPALVQKALIKADYPIPDIFCHIDIDEFGEVQWKREWTW